jgi:hypothetical protein
MHPHKHPGNFSIDKQYEICIMGATMKNKRYIKKCPKCDMDVTNNMSQNCFICGTNLVENLPIKLDRQEVKKLEAIYDAQLDAILDGIKQERSGR